MTEDDDSRSWPYGTAPERIRFLANARKRAMEPMQSENESVRLVDYASYTKVIFLNDVLFTYQSIVRLLATRIDGDPSSPADYDLACAMDFGYSGGWVGERSKLIEGLRDTWVARDICGTPFRAFWPYVKDEASVKRVKEEEPFEVAACWNGAVAFPAGPYLYRPTDDHYSAQGWKMVDDGMTVRCIPADMT